MKKNFRGFGLLLFIFTLTGCVTALPVSFVNKVSKDFEGNETCIKMLTSIDPKDCRRYEGICARASPLNKRGNVLYQVQAQALEIASFAVSRDLEDKVVRCSWNYAGFARGYSYLDNGVLAACEKSRRNHMIKNEVSLQPCEIYAHNNEILP